MMKNTLRLFALPVSCAALFLSAGCSGLLPDPEYHETVTYDLGLPEVRKPLPFPLVIRPCSADTSARYKMLFRSGERLVPDEFARWSRTPAEMLTRYCRIAFSRSLDRIPADTPAREYLLTGSVLACETDLTASVSRLYVKCALCDSERDFQVLWSKTYFISEPVTISKEAPGKGAADSMRRAAEKLVQDLDQDLSGLADRLKADGKKLPAESPAKGK